MNPITTFILISFFISEAPEGKFQHQNELPPIPDNWLKFHYSVLHHEGYVHDGKLTSRGRAVAHQLCNGGRSIGQAVKHSQKDALAAVVLGVKELNYDNLSERGQNRVKEAHAKLSESIGSGEVINIKL